METPSGSPRNARERYGTLVRVVHVIAHNISMSNNSHPRLWPRIHATRHEYCIGRGDTRKEGARGCAALDSAAENDRCLTTIKNNNNNNYHHHRRDKTIRHHRGGEVVDGDSVSSGGGDGNASSSLIPQERGQSYPGPNPPRIMCV